MDKQSIDVPYNGNGNSRDALSVAGWLAQRSIEWLPPNGGGMDAPRLPPNARGREGPLRRYVQHLENDMQLAAAYDGPDIH